QVASPGCGQVLPQRLPIIAIVKADEHAALVAGVQQAATHRIGPDGADDLVAGETARDLGPGSAAVVSAEDVRPPIVDPLAVYCDIGRCWIERRHVDARNLAPRGDAWGRELRPARA